MLQGRVSLCGMRNRIWNSRSVEENPWVYFVWTVFPWCCCRTEFFICAGLCAGSWRTPFWKTLLWYLEVFFGGGILRSAQIWSEIYVYGFVKEWLRSISKENAFPEGDGLRSRNSAQLQENLVPFLSSVSKAWSPPTAPSASVSVAPCCSKLNVSPSGSLRLSGTAFCQATCHPKRSSTMWSISFKEKYMNTVGACGRWPPDIL